MKKWKISFWVCFALLIFSNVALLYGIFDQAITITYMEQGQKDQIQANQVLGNLVVQGSKEYNQQDFLHLLRQAYPEEFIVEENDSTIMGQNKFTFSAGKLVEAK